MTKQEYEYIQTRLTAKVKGPSNFEYNSLTPKEKQGYKKAILATKSLIKEIYNKSKT